MDRKALRVDLESAAEWYRRPEWQYVLAMFQESHDKTMRAFVAADPNDNGAIGRLQGQIKVCRYVLDGGLRSDMTEELKKKEKEPNE